MIFLRIFVYVLKVSLLPLPTFLSLLSVDDANNSQISSQDILEKISYLLGMDKSLLNIALCTRKLTIGTEVTSVPLDFTQAIDARNAFAKEIYGRLFAHIVTQANISLAPSRTSSNSSGELKSIGLLDIFGFEILAVNSLEQLAINFCNEKLQNHFIYYILKREQDLYTSEGITYVRIQPKENDDVIALIEAKPAGLFATLDEEVRLPKGSDTGFLSKIERVNPKSATSRFYRDVKMSKSQFEIRHFAGDVRYESTGFLEKNKDKLYEHLEDSLQESSLASFRNIMLMYGPRATSADTSVGASVTVSSPSANKANKLVSLVGRFQSQLQELFQAITTSEPHFVRCIKPNNSKSSDIVDTGLILQQLRYSGVLEAIQIRKSGYPGRRSLQEFRGNYWALVGMEKAEHQTLGDKEKCDLIIRKLQMRTGVVPSSARLWEEHSGDMYKDIKVGRTIVFFKPEVLSALEGERRARVGWLAILAQKIGRMYIATKKVRVLSAARQVLRDTIQDGSKNNRSNIAILPSCTCSRTKLYRSPM